MELTFLGTSAGVPTHERNVSAVAIRALPQKAWYLVDCGEGTQQQLLKVPLTLKNLQAIFITHVHGDHCYGLPGLIASAAMSGRTEPLWIIAPRAVQTFLEVIRATTQLYLSYTLHYIALEDTQAIWPSFAFKVDVIPLSHRVPSVAFAFTERYVTGKLNVAKLQQDRIPTGPIWGALQQGQDIRLEDGRLLVANDYLLSPRRPRKIIIAGDNDMPSLLREAAQAADVLVHEATYTQDIADKVGSAPQHSTAQQVARVAQQVQLPHLILTHFSARYRNDQDISPSMWDVEREARAEYSGALWLAKDFDVYQLDTKGLVHVRSGG